MKTIYPVLLVLWLSAFGFITGFIAQDVSRLRLTYDRLETTALSLNTDATGIHDQAVDIHEATQQLEFLTGLMNLLPQEKGFIRTQRAMASEVEALRRKVGRRIGDLLHIVVDTRANK